MTDKLDIGIITYPGESGSDQPVSLFLSRFFSEILMPLCGNLSAITGNLLEISDKAVRIIRVPFYESGSSSLSSRFSKYVLSQLRVFHRLINISKNSDVIIFFSLAELYTVLIFITKFVFRKKVMVVHCGLTSKSMEIAYGKKMFGSGKIIIYAIKLLENISFLLADEIAVESESVIKSHGLQKYRSKICICTSYYIYIDAFAIEKDIEGRQSLVGYVGRFGKDKGAINFVEAVSKVPKSQNVKFLMLGGFSSEVRKIEALLEESGLTHRVAIVGHVSYEKIPVYLNDLKLLVLPSYGEGLPKTILEAMACGTPVLATPVGGVPDVIKDEETGFILEDNSPEGIAKNIVRVLEYPKLDEIIKNARDLIEREYAYEPTLKRWQYAFEKLIKSDK